MTALPLFHYPLTIGMVDDDPLILQAVTRMLNDDYFHKTFSNVNDGLAYFKSYNPLIHSTDFLRGRIEDEHYETVNSSPVDIDMSALTQLRDNVEKHHEISVLIVDYNMPNMTGLEFCREIQALPMKKILLTGEVDYLQAVSAFNDGIIDRFVRKDSTNLADESLLYVKTLSNQYLCDATRQLAAHLEVGNQLPISDKKFISFFKEWCHANHIREHYLLDKQGNFTLVDNQGKISHLIIHTDKTLNDFSDLYNENEKLLPFVNSVSSREKIPFFGPGKEAWQFEISEWPKHFYAPSFFDGDQRYYWALTK